MARNVRIFAAAIALIVAALAVAAAPTGEADAGVHWESIPGPVYEAGFNYSQAACTGADPHWIDQPWGWTCPANKGRLMLSHCEQNPYNAWKWEIRVWIRNAEIHWGAPGGPASGQKWANSTTDWNVHFIVDRTPAAQYYCAGWHPPYW